MCYSRSSKMGSETKQHYSAKYKCSTSNLRRLESFLLMHYEDLQQSSLIQGAWLLKTAVLSHFIKAARLPLEINFGGLLNSELMVENSRKGSFSAGDTLPTNPQPCPLVLGCPMVHKCLTLVQKLSKNSAENMY